MDGYSRFIVYLQCSSNNGSFTVLELFETAVQNYGLPDRVEKTLGDIIIIYSEYTVTFTVDPLTLHTGCVLLSTQN